MTFGTVEISMKLEMRIEASIGIFFIAIALSFSGLRLALAEYEVEIGDRLEFTREIHGRILNSQERKPFEDYTIQLVGISRPLEMVAISGGEFMMGSRQAEQARQVDEGPRHRRKVDSFWMGRFEVTQEQFERYYRETNSVLSEPEISLGQLQVIEAEKLAELVSGPTELIPSFERTIRPQTPIAGFSQHAASKFCQWLSVKTGKYFRLPTEAEWEYACRAGTTTSYHFGDDPARLNEYGWFYDNSDDRVHSVGMRKPNAWGLHDMHGNVMEWCLDQYLADAYQVGKGQVPASARFPRVARGGSWWDDPKDLRSAARFASSEKWNRDDYRGPKSLWYMVNAPWLGFRVVNPREIPDVETMHTLWNSGIVADRKEMELR